MIRFSVFLFFVFSGFSLWCQDSILIKNQVRLINVDSSVINLYPVFSDQSTGIVQTKELPVDFQQVDPCWQPGLTFGNLGNVGSSHKTLIYLAVPDITYDMGFHAFDLYQLRTDNIIFYRGARPYTKVFYTQLGGQNNGYFKGTYGRELSKTLTLHLNYSRISHLGFYQRQKVKHTGLTLGLWYQGLKNKYKAWAVYSSNYNTQQDNGGITTDTLFDDQIYAQRDAVPVKISGADTRYVQYEASLGQSYKIINPEKSALLTIVHRFKYLKQQYKFSDPIENSEFYGPYNTYVKGLRYYSKNNGIYNYIGVQTGFESNNRSFIIEPGISYNRFDITFDSSGYVWNELWLLGSLSGSIGRFKINAKAQYGVLDNKSSFRLDGDASGDLGKWASLSAKMILQRYPGTAMNFSFNISKYPVWENSLEKITEFALYANLELKPLQLNVYARQFLLDKYIYFDQQALVSQLDNSFIINQFGIDHKLNIWKIHFNNQIHFQTKSSDKIRYPDWVTRHSLYFEGKVFKNNLFLRPGVDLRYISKYYADNYMPASGQFFLQDAVQLPDQWMADIFIGFAVTNFQGFAKMENVTRWAKNSIQYFSPLYPLPEAKFRIGLQWQFLN